MLSFPVATANRGPRAASPGSNFSPSRLVYALVLGMALGPSPGHAGSPHSPALCSRPHLYLEHVMHKNEKTGSKDHDDYDESENLCW